MKQRHSYSDLVYHLIFVTKLREPFIASADIKRLFGYCKTKAHKLDAYLEEFGGWRDHIHLMIRSRPSLALSEVYRQLKGFSSFAWKKQTPNRPFQWADGTFSMTVDPLNCEQLRQYIRNQAIHHQQGELIDKWEPEE